MVPQQMYFAQQRTSWGGGLETKNQGSPLLGMILAMKRGRPHRSDHDDKTLSNAGGICSQYGVGGEEH